MVEGKHWQDVSMTELATNARYWKLTPTDQWHGFTKVVDIAHVQYEDDGIPGPVSRIFDRALYFKSQG